MHCNNTHIDDEPTYGDDRPRPLTNAPTNAKVKIKT